MELKTNASVSFTWALLAYWIQILSSTGQNGEDWGKRIRNWKKLATFSCLDVVNSKNSPNVNRDNFSRQNSLDFAFLVLNQIIRNVECFETSTKFGFSTIYDLKTAKLQWHCLFTFIMTIFWELTLQHIQTCGTPFFDITLTTDSSPSNAKYTLNWPIKYIELTYQIYWSS